MGDVEKWREATEALYGQKAPQLKQGLLGDLGLSPLGLQGGEPGDQAHLWERDDYVNIIPFHPQGVTPEFLRSPRAGVALNTHGWPEELEAFSGPVFLPLSPILSPWKKALKNSKKEHRLNLGIDPYSLGLWKSCLYRSHLEEKWIQVFNEQPGATFRLTAQPYDLAGASDIQQLAILISSVSQLVYDYQGTLSPGEVFQSLSLELPLKAHLWASLAKLSALKMLLARLMEVFHLSPTQAPPPIYAVPSVKLMAAREPWNNLLKLTAMAAAASMGGASGFMGEAFDFLSKKPKGYRVTRNLVEILERESHLGRVALPALGSFSLREITEVYAQRAWTLFGEMERKEGLGAVLRSGWLYEQVKTSAQFEQEQVRKAQWSLIGTNEFPLLKPLTEEPPFPKKEEVHDMESWWQHQYEEEKAPSLCHVVRWPPYRLTEIFEKFQFHGDDLAASLPVMVEEGQQTSPRLQNCKKWLALGGLGLEILNPNSPPPSSVLLVVATDPESAFVKKCLASYGPGVFKLWAGAKRVEGFQACFGEDQDFTALFTKIYKALGSPL